MTRKVTTQLSRGQITHWKLKYPYKLTRQSHQSRKILINSKLLKIIAPLSQLHHTLLNRNWQNSLSTWLPGSALTPSLSVKPKLSKHQLCIKNSLREASRKHSNKENFQTFWYRWLQSAKSIVTHHYSKYLSTRSTCFQLD